MAGLALVLRLLMGIPLLVFGSNHFLEFIDIRPPGPPTAGDTFLQQVRETGYLMDAVVVAHLFTGLLLLLNRYVPLALLVHLPVTVNMVLFHVFLDVQKGPIAFVIAGVHLMLLWVYRKSFSTLLSFKVDVAQ